MPWPVVSGLLDRMNLIEFRRHAHLAMLGQMVAGALGAKDTKLQNYLLGYAQLEKAERRKWQASRLESEAADQDFALLVKAGLVSQFIFDCLTT